MTRRNCKYIHIASMALAKTYLDTVRGGPPLCNTSCGPAEHKRSCSTPSMKCRASDTGITVSCVSRPSLVSTQHAALPPPSSAMDYSEDLLSLRPGTIILKSSLEVNAVGTLTSVELTPMVPPKSFPVQHRNPAASSNDKSKHLINLVLGIRSGSTPLSAVNGKQGCEADGCLPTFLVTPSNPVFATS